MPVPHFPPGRDAAPAEGREEPGELYVLRNLPLTHVGWYAKDRDGETVYEVTILRRSFTPARYARYAEEARELAGRPNLKIV